MNDATWEFGPPGGAPDPDPADEGWQRLDWRLLLLGPVDALKQFAFPALIAVIGVSSSRGSFEPWMLVLAVLGPVLLGVIPWLTTEYRFTGTQFQIRKGLLNKQQLTAPLDRVRSVDLESSLMHRILGLTKVQIGTGVDDSRMELKAVSTQDADALRQRLLRRSASAASSSAEEAGPVDPWAAPSETAAQLLATLDPAWVRFAPLSLSRLAVVAGAVGALSQVADDLPVFDQEHLGGAWEWVRGFALPLVIVAGLVGGLVGWLVISVVGYLVQWFGLRLTRSQASLHLTAGMFTTRSTTVEEARVRGVRLGEALLLRLADGAELSTLSTGVGSGGVTAILPPSPLSVCTRVGSDVLGDPRPLTVPLIDHGPAARRRSLLRALRPPLVLVLATSVATWLLHWSWWLPVVVAIAALSVGVLAGATAYRNLGHELTEGHLVSGAGVFDRTRTVLERDGIIGWVVSQSWFQRRRGLATLVATTAAGSERVVVFDVPLPRAVALADAATPGMVTPFLG